MNKKLKTFLFASVALGCVPITVLAMEDIEKIVSSSLPIVAPPLEEDDRELINNFFINPYKAFTDTKSETEAEETILPSIDKLKEAVNKMDSKTSLDLEEALMDNQTFTFTRGDSRKEKERIGILSLDGGGFRGLMEACWLNRLEKITGRAPHKLFDIIGGTSIGGILALAAVTPSQENENLPVLSTEEMIDLFVKNGHNIFPQRNSYNLVGKFYDKVTSIIRARYSEKPLEEMLVSYFRNTRLKSALTNVVITAATTTQKPVLFSSCDAETKDYMMFEAARATSAAPSYFRAFPLILPNSTTKEYLVDGGLWQNNPASLAFAQAMDWVENGNYKRSKENTILLSFGTGRVPMTVQPENAGWANSGFPVIESVFNTPAQGVHKSIEKFLPKENYLRINPKLPQNIALDTVGEESIRLLQEAAETKYEELEAFVKEGGGLRLILEQTDK